MRRRIVSGVVTCIWIYFLSNGADASQKQIWLQCEYSEHTEFSNGSPPLDYPVNTIFLVFDKQRSTLQWYEDGRILDNNTPIPIPNSSPGVSTATNTYTSSVSANGLYLTRTTHVVFDDNTSGDRVDSITIDRSSLSLSANPSGRPFNDTTMSGSGHGSCRIIPPKPVKQNAL